MDRVEKFRFIINYEYEGKNFKVFQNQNLQNYFLRVLDSDNLLYPTLEEFDELYRRFNWVQAKLSTSEKEDSNINSENEFENTSNKKWKFRNIFKMEPKVIVKLLEKTKDVAKKAMLVSLPTAMLLTGNMIGLTEEQKAYASQEIFLNKQLQEICEQRGIQYDALQDNSIMQGVEARNNANVVQLGIEHIPALKTANISAEQIINAINEHQHISEENKKIAIEWFKKRREIFPNESNAVLYYHLLQGKGIAEISEDEIEKMEEEDGINYGALSGLCNAVTGEVWVNMSRLPKNRDGELTVAGRDLKESVLAHEMGHATELVIAFQDVKPEPGEGNSSRLFDGLQEERDEKQEQAMNMINGKINGSNENVSFHGFSYFIVNR